MVLLSLQGVTKLFGVNCVLKDINLTLKQGQRMGLVGVNGSGKSTLFKIIMGQEQADEGTVSLVKGAQAGILTQHADIQSDLTVYQELERVFEPLKAMERKLRDLEARMAEEHQDERAMMTLSEEYDRLTRRFEDAGGYEWPSRISGVLAGLGLSGERRNQCVGLLSGGEKTRLCLAKILLQQPDLLLLDEPTNHLDLNATQFLEDTLKKYKGTVLVVSHDRYFLNSVCDCMAELSMTHLDQYEGNYDAFARQRQANLERRLKEYNLQQAEIARQQAIIARYRQFNREKSIRAAESREKRLEKMERLERPVEEQKVRFSFQARRRTGDDVLMIKDLAKGFEGRTLFEHFSLHLRVRGALALFLLTGDDVFQPIKTLSGGEKGRVALAKLMLRKDNLLLLDEPTNHLDMDSREVLEHALDDFDGTILTVSHDRYFINRVANRVIEMTAEGVTEYLGNYDDYLEKKRRLAQGEDDPALGKTKTELEKEKRRARLARESQKALRQRVSELEQRIADEEERIANLESAMADPETYQDAELAQRLAQDHHAAQQGLEALYEEWEEAALLAAEKES